MEHIAWSHCGDHFFLAAPPEAISNYRQFQALQSKRHGLEGGTQSSVVAPVLRGSQFSKDLSTKQPRRSKLPPVFLARPCATQESVWAEWERVGGGDREGDRAGGPTAHPAYKARL